MRCALAALVVVVLTIRFPAAQEPNTRPKEAAKKHWAFQPVANRPVPAVRDPSWPLNEIDHFVRARLERQGLAPAEPADKRTLLRRVTYDLTGLPPTPEEIDAFLADDTPQAFARVVDRLLASPAYGERWGRHWLDVVRYADTAGDNSDYPIPQMYKYRNWVLRAFNRDLPYDAFLTEQFAGDLLPARDEEDRRDKTLATGYLANTRRFGSYEDKRYQWYLTYEDTIDNLGRTVLGLTINCARCHDHKFDPITSEDYYALYGFFQSTRYPWPGIELAKVPYDLVPLVPSEQAEAVQKARQQKLAELDAEIKRLGKDKADAEKLKAVKKERERLEKEPLPFETAYAVAESSKKIGNACVQLRGDPAKPGKEVPRRFPTVLGGQTLPPDTKSSGRLELARWLTDPANPLTARVLVNRLWLYHFGKGLVPTPSDFGKQGTPPSHPELLDWLARRFVADGWSLKAMHRLMVLSRTYQLSGSGPEANAHVDPNNDLLWRYNRRRLEAEAIRDALMMVSGTLDRGVGGPHPFPDQTTWDFTQHKPFKAVYASDRRSVYLMTQRIQRHPYLALFDGPDTNASTARRVTSTTPLQALYLLNDPFVHEQARRFAARLQRECDEDAGRIERAHLMLLGRPPTTAEQAASADYLDRLRAELPSERAWESYVRALFLTNEFVYVN